MGCRLDQRVRLLRERGRRERLERRRELRRLEAIRRLAEQAMEIHGSMASMIHGAYLNTSRGLRRVREMIDELAGYIEGDGGLYGEEGGVRESVG